MPRFDVTIAGELNLDVTLYGQPDELPPERCTLSEMSPRAPTPVHLEIDRDRSSLWRRCTIYGPSSIELDQAHYFQGPFRKPATVGHVMLSEAC